MTQQFMQISNSGYFQHADGKTYLPIGLNLAFVRNSETYPEEEVLATYRRWLTKLAGNGGNFARIWLGVPFFDVMPEGVGDYDRTNLKHIQAVIRMAEKLGVKLKFTLEHFRRLRADRADAESFPGAASFVKPLYQSICSTAEEFLDSEAGRQAYLGKARFLAENGIGDSPAVIAVELWNEFNTIAASWESKASWSRHMLQEIQAIFPRQMILQNLGSFSGPTAYALYDWLGGESGNRFMQAHRYLDPGAELDICRGPVDRLSADAVRELRERRPDLPAILAEGGAVEANHSGHSKLYEKDAEGTILHDVLFAPFFAGAAGGGQIWHWDHIYVEKHDLHWHFNRFAEAVKSIDPVAENFRPFHTETHRLRIYGLAGKTMNLLWCRDKASDWQSELAEGIPAALIEGETAPVGPAASCRTYDPWQDAWSEVKVEKEECRLPPFRRSIVVHIKRNK